MVTIQGGGRNHGRVTSRTRDGTAAAGDSYLIPRFTMDRTLTMKRKRILLILGVLIVVAAVVGIVVARAQSGVAKVVTGKVVRQNIVAQVSGTGQIKPKTYVNVGATAFGRITHLYVKEGDKVHRGQLLATIESVQARAGVDAQQAAISSAKTDVSSYEAAEKTAEASVAHAKADLEQKRLDFGRAQGLYDNKLISKQDYDSRKAAYDTDVATLAQQQAALVQSRAETASAVGKVGSAVANLRSNYDSLNKTASIAPFNGIVTNLPVREGETVVVGIQNAEGSTLMTLADMSVITAEVKVDETDIVNLQPGQSTDVTVDALPGKVFKGHVTQIGDQAILRSTGIATSQSTTGTEEAKDFKVVVTLDHPSEELRPGLSATAKITTAEKSNTVAIPIQALTMRRPSELVDKKSAKSGNSAHAAEISTDAPKDDSQVQGVFVLRGEKRKTKVVFVPVKTGITGATDIEVLSGLKPGDEIVTGSYKTLRTLKNDTPVKIIDADAVPKEGETT
jgi:HlyD family secretion protein